jgi:hypothetical protein
VTDEYPDDPDTPETLAAVLGEVVRAYVARRGFSVRTRIECLGALEDCRAELYNDPKRFGATN